jgi:uncharacterized protein
LEFAGIVLLGLAVGVLVGLLGIGGGVVLVPALVYLLHFDQHTAQGTSLFMQLPPLGLAALYVYWKNDFVDIRSGIICAACYLVGGYFGGFAATHIPARDLHALFGMFLIACAFLLDRQAGPEKSAEAADGAE